MTHDVAGAPALGAPILNWIDHTHGDVLLAYMAATTEKAIAHLDAADTEYDRVIHDWGRESRKALTAQIKRDYAGETLMHLSYAIRAYLGYDFHNADDAVQAVAAER